MDLDDVITAMVGGVLRLAEFLWWWGPAPSKRARPRVQVYLTLYRVGFAAVLAGGIVFAGHLMLG
jgi:hypothetical protein